MPSLIVICLDPAAKVGLYSAYKTPSVLFTLGLELLQVSAALVIVVPAVGMYDVAYVVASACAPNIYTSEVFGIPLIP